LRKREPETWALLFRRRYSFPYYENLTHHIERRKMSIHQDKIQSDKIETVLREVIAEGEDFEPGDILLDWVVVCYAENPDREKGSSYPTFYANGLMPTYRARGLLKTGLMEISLDDIVEDD